MRAALSPADYCASRSFAYIAPQMMDVFTQLALSSDAAQMAVAGALFWLLAGFAALMEWRRKKMRDYAQLERVGWVPWTAIFIMGAMIGGGCLAMSLPVVLGSL